VLRELEKRAAALHAENWLLLDDPAVQVLEAELAARGALEDPAGRRLVIGCRVSRDRKINMS
jgi:hypothetical protein